MPGLIGNEVRRFGIPQSDIVLFAVFQESMEPWTNEKLGLTSGWVGNVQINHQMWRVMPKPVIPLKPKNETWLKNSPEEKLLRKRRQELDEPNAFMLMVPNTTDPSGWVAEVVRLTDIMRIRADDLVLEAGFQDESGNTFIARSLMVAYSARTGNHDLEITQM